MKYIRRHEFKYLLTPAQARAVEQYLEKIKLAEDSYSAGAAYVISSLYFDTPALTDYYDKAAGLEHRKKLRLRFYHDQFSDSSQVWVEVKRKHDMTITKERHPVPISEWQAFLEQSRFFDPRPLAARNPATGPFFYQFLAEGYRPHLVVRYRRRAFTAHFLSPVRLTLDSRIEACKLKDWRYNVPMTPVYPGRTVLEIKFALAMPWWFKDMVYRFELARLPFSKYTLSVDALNRVNSLPR